MWYYVITRIRGDLHIQGKYKTRDAAERRADKIQGGETHVFKSMSSEPEKVIQEFRDDEIRRL